MFADHVRRRRVHRWQSRSAGNAAADVRYRRREDRLRGRLQGRPSQQITDGLLQNHRYYVCGGAQKSGHASCPSPSIPADQIEAFVVGEIKTIASDHELIAEIYERIQSKSKATRDDLLRERDGLIEFLRSYHVQLQHLAITNGPTELVADLQTRISTSERRHTELQEQIATLEAKAPLRSDIADSLARFDEIWQSMKSKDRCGLIELLIARIDYDGVQGSVEIHFHNTGIVTLGTAPETSERTT